MSFAGDGPARIENAFHQTYENWNQSAGDVVYIESLWLPLYT